MSGRGFTDWQDLGVFPLQDHESDVPVELRQLMAGARISKIQDPGTEPGYVEFAEEAQHGTIGDLHPWLFWQTDKVEKRGMGSWAMTFPALAVGGGAGGGGTSAGAGGTQFKPIRYRDFETDVRYKDVTPGQPVGFPSIPQGTVMVMMGGMDEGSQQTLGMHADPRLIAAHADGPGDAGTLVCDLQGRGEICMDGSIYPGIGGRHARLQTMMRVIALPPEGIPKLGTGPGNSLAWNMASTQQEGLAGYGMCYAPMSGRGGPITKREPIKRLPTPVTPQPRNRKGINNPPPSTGPSSQGDGPGPLGAGDDGETPRHFGQFRASSRGGHGIMLLSATASGPLHAGSTNDKHHIGQDADGHPINAGHISTNAYFWRSAGNDGPLLFEGNYPNPKPQPLKGKVHLSWDPALKHPFIGGPQDGMWRWWCEYHVVVPDGGDPPTTGGGKGGGGKGGNPTPGTPSTPTPGTPGPPPTTGPPTSGGGGPPPPTPGPPGQGTPTTPGPGTPPATPQPGKLPTPITPQPRNPDRKSPSRVDPRRGATTPGNGPPKTPTEPKDPRETPITPYPDPPKTPTAPPEPFGPGDLIRPGDELERRYTEPRQHAIDRMKAAAPEPTGSRVIVGDVSREDVGLWTLHHPFAESFTELSFRPQLMVDGYPSFVHNALSDADFVEADEGVRPQVLSGKSWGAQNADGEWAYDERSHLSRARGGTADGGFLLTPPAFELEDYFDLGSNLDVLAPTTQSYFAFAPGVALAFGLPNLDGGLNAKAITFDQDQTHGNFKGAIKQLNASRVGQTLIDLELDQTGDEIVVGIGGSQAFRLPRGAQAARQSNIALVGGEMRIVTDGGSDQVEYYDLQLAAWTTLSSGGGATSFLGLTDTPANYTGAALQAVRVNAGATALEYIDLDTLYTPTLDLASNANGLGASLIGIEDPGALITATTVEGALAELAAAAGVSTFVALTDTPANFTGGALQAVRVNAGETALEYIDLDTIYATDAALTAALANYTLTSVLASTAGAAGIGILDTGALITATDVEGALAEIQTALNVEEAALVTHKSSTDHDSRYTTTTDLASNANGLGASLIGIEDPGALITATTVEGALVELAAAAGVTTFVALTDTPANYTGAALQAVRVNAAATALEYVDLDTIYATDAALTAALANYTLTSVLASTAGAAGIGILDSGLLFTATDVEAALAETAAALNVEEAALVTHKTSTDHDSRYHTQSDLASTAVNLGADLIGIFDIGSIITATTVEDALTEIVQNLNSDIAALATHKTSTDHDSRYTTTTILASTAGAAGIGILDSGLLFTATDVEAALAETAAALNVEEAALVTHKTSADHDGRYVELAGDTMTGALLMPDGTVSLPAVAFSGDTNTGMFRRTTDTLVLVTAGVNALEIDAAGQVGIGTAGASISHQLHVIESSAGACVRLEGHLGFGAGARLHFGDGTFVYLAEEIDDYLRIHGQNGISLTSNSAANYSGVGGGAGTTSHKSTWDVHGSFGAAVSAVKTSAYTAADERLILCDTNTVGAFTVTLPAASSVTGRIYSIKKVDSSANVLTVSTTGGESIDAATTWTTATQYDCLSIMSDGSNWHMLNFI